MGFRPQRFTAQFCTGVQQWYFKNVQIMWFYGPFFFPRINHSKYEYVMILANYFSKIMLWVKFLGSSMSVCRVFGYDKVRIIIFLHDLHR